MLLGRCFELWIAAYARSGTRLSWDSTGEVRLTKGVDQSLREKNMVLVENILDTGLTLTFLKRLLLGHKPRRLRVAALLYKLPAARW